MYRVFLKAPSHLQGQVLADKVTVGSTSSTLAFQWLRSDSTVSSSLAAGDATDDNRVNLADYGVFVRYVDVNSANQLLWPQAPKWPCSPQKSLSAVRNPQKGPCSGLRAYRSASLNGSVGTDSRSSRRQPSMAAETSGVEVILPVEGQVYEL